MYSKLLQKHIQKIRIIAYTIAAAPGFSKSDFLFSKFKNLILHIPQLTNVSKAQGIAFNVSY
jgi:hypothetical protein